MMAARQIYDVAGALPPVRGRLVAGAPLTRYTWFRTGGPAEYLFEPADPRDLADFLAALDPAIPVVVLGTGSNLLVRDGGVEGVVIRLGKAFAGIHIEGRDIVAGAGATDIAVAHAARDAGLAGLEFLRGIPGTIGGAVRMNAGAYGHEIADILVAARIVGRDGEVRDLDRAALGFGYRKSTLGRGAIVIEARLSGTPDDPAVITARMAGITAAREASQPVRTRTGGSTFKNPDGAKAWELIDAAGCRGLGRGGAMVSDKHANFLINTGAASAADIEALGEEVRRRVEAKTGIRLEWEIERIGRHEGGES